MTEWFTSYLFVSIKNLLYFNIYSKHFTSYCHE